MRIRKAALWAIRIPFVEAFRHALISRSASDAVIMMVEDEDGVRGYGEALPRPYVTGETTESVLRTVTARWWPLLQNQELPDTDLALHDAALEETSERSAAARAMLTTALLDCGMRRNGIGIRDILPPVREKIEYSAVVTATHAESTERIARQFAKLGMRHFKVKVGFDDDRERLLAVRKYVPEESSLRIDANAAWDADAAITNMHRLDDCRLAAVEQPLPRGDVKALARVRENIAVPIVADESLLDAADAEELIDAKAVDIFNIRISKCGGIYRSLALAERAFAAGLAVQIGSQVGETAILTLAGRAVSAHLPAVVWNEGSFGTLLLSEDLSRDAVRFGHGGIATLPSRAGFGYDIMPERLEAFALQRIDLA